MNNDLKEQILIETDGGLLFYNMVLNEHGQKLTKYGNKFKPLRNPFYGDKKASMSIYLKDGKYMFYDHGEPSYKGDVFDFAKHHYGKDLRFPEVLEKMWNDIKNCKLSIIKGLENNNSKNKVSNKGSKINHINYSKETDEYFYQYGITIEILQKYNVFQVGSYINNDGILKDSWNKQILMVYQFDGYAKFYSPYPKKMFFYTGSVPKDYVFGLEQLVDDKEPEKVFIVGGEKDVMTMHALGYNAICCSGENAEISYELLEELHFTTLKPIIFYDNDPTGKKRSKELSLKNQISYINLDSILTDTSQVIKDVSDYVKEKLSIEKLEELLSSEGEIVEAEDYEEVEELASSVSSKSLHLKEEVNNENYFNDEIIDDVDEKTVIKNLDDNIFKQLPTTLQEICGPFNEKGERDLVFISSLVLLGNMLPNCFGIYDGRKIEPNLFALVIAPASSGKGVIRWAKHIGKYSDKKLYNEYLREKLEWEKEGCKTPSPVLKSIFIPGNSSTSAMIESLNNNSGRGVIMESEADTISNTLKTDWGDFSSILRCAFEHETISINRKSGNGIVRIESPCLSLLVTGTPNQLFSFIPNTENGLFSRMIFFQFPINLKWKDVFEQKLNLEAYFNKIGKRIYEYTEDLKDIEVVEFNYSEEQEGRFNTIFETWQNWFYALHGMDSVSIVRRLGNIHFRIAMILTVLRALDEDKLENNLICNEIDFNIALSLVNTFKLHAKNIYQQIPKTNHTYKILKTNESKFYDDLPEEFNFNTAVEIGNILKIPKGTTERFLRKFRKNDLIDRSKHDWYIKLDLSN